ncbi:MAG: hypothetical protein GT589_03695 [Peptoclostridium sp.]|uniref:hypothetical protein n=1 Tax=Peptoclostridium sp. TaxID=1904860 RepID=UPI00139EBE3D|nr:hypothetical protein [Peptoclostridium sp.]MZQ75244.1 hypothetical protein [Peptoclostridium sp.]
MNIGCYLLSEGKFEKAALSENLLTELAKSLRQSGKEMVHFASRSIEVEGIFIPAKNSTTALMAIPEEAK